LSANCFAKSLTAEPRAKQPTDIAWRDLRSLADDSMEGRKTGSQGILKAQNYIIERYQQIGLRSFNNSSEYQHPFVKQQWPSDISGVNLIGWLKGQHKPEAFIVISAHYDHIGKRGTKVFNGADDNASGVAAMLFIAENLALTKPFHSVIFLATDAEELGLHGAYAFTQQPPVSIQQIRFNLNLDMLAQGGSKKRLYVYGARKYPQFKTLIEELNANVAINIKSGRRAFAKGYSHGKRINWIQASDHGAFHKASIPFLFLGVAEHRYYHTDKDTVETIDQDFYRAAVMASLNTFRAMDAL
jgi:Zn-dependent M28 family amino/carboxypeptidase